MTQTAAPERTSRRSEGGGAGSARRAPVPVAERGKDHLVLGGVPRAHLLPPEVHAERQSAAMRRRLGFGVLAVVAVVALAVVGAGAAATSAQAQLAGEQASTQSLLAQELKYVKVRQVQDRIHLIETAQKVGASTEIAWKPYLDRVQATLPGDAEITTVNIDSATPIELYPQATASLQGPRVATVVFTAKTHSLPAVSSWLDALKTLPGYADALPGSVERDDVSGDYTATITMHVNADAFSHRFAQNTGK